MFSNKRTNFPDVSDFQTCGDERAATGREIRRSAAQRLCFAGRRAAALAG